MKHKSMMLLLLTLPAVFEMAVAHATDLRVYIGTYTGGASEGIYQTRLDPQTGMLENPVLAVKVENPSFLAAHPQKPFLYSTGQGTNASGKKEGLVSAFAILPGDGKLTLLNQQPTVGEGPCHIAVGKEGRHVLVANYGGGSLTVLPIAEDGRLGVATDFIQHKGSSVHPQRQQGPHTHSVTLDGTGRYAIAADLGLDKLLVYRYDVASGSLEEHEPPFIAVKPGAGPRHFAFHPSGRSAYVVNELDNTVTAFSYDETAGRMEEIQSVGTLPKDFTGENTTAEIRVHPAGRFLYASNRGHDSIAVFSVEEATGRLTSLGQTPSRGKTPRNFNISPDGNFLLAANQESDTLAAFRVHPDTGTLEALGEPVTAPTPVCVCFYVP